MRPTTIAFAAALLTASAALAHQGVQNAAVKARMDGMSAIAANMKTLGQMAKGEKEFDTVQARSAAAAIARHAAAAPGLFEPEETDPKTEALPAIWTNFADFTAKAADLEAIATGLSTSINDAADLGPAMRALGGSCKACHERYRE